MSKSVATQKRKQGNKQPLHKSTGKQHIRWDRLGSSIDEFRNGIRNFRVTPQVQRQELIKELKPYSFGAPVPLNELTNSVIRLFQKYSLHVTHPRYFGLFNPGVHESGIVAETLAAAFNPQLAAWSHSPIANEIEQHVLQAFARLLGFPERETAAHFATGGAEANLTALLVALSHKCPAWAEKGTGALNGFPRIYISASGHDSIAKAARACGLGTDAVRSLPAPRPSFAIDPGQLEKAIAEDKKSGCFPLVIVGTAGTTSTGAIDPLPALAAVARKHGAWLHIDAAWGGAACLSPKLRKHIAGIELADSVTWDAHKWLSVPYAAGMFFCRHPEAVRRAFSMQTSYMPGHVPDTLDPYATTLQWTRKTMGLKVFMSLAELGIDGYRRLIERQVSIGDLLRRRLKQHGYEVTNETPLPVICFTHPLVREGTLGTTEVLNEIYARGKVWISDVTPDGTERFFRACITHYDANEGDIECLLEEVEQAIKAALRLRSKNSRRSLTSSN